VQTGAVIGPEYRVVVRGELDSRFAYLFDGMQMERVAGTTVLTGRVVDQAQLHGFIERIEELGLELLSLQQTSGRVRVRPTGRDLTGERGESDR
jgi:hypothetical protein